MIETLGSRRTTVVVASAALVVQLTAGCGAASVSGGTTARANEAVAREERTYTFERAAMRARHGEENATTLRGTLRLGVPDAAGVHALHITAARYAQGEYVVREMDPAAGGEPIDVEQHVDGRGGAEPLDEEANFALGSELRQALEIVPIGSCGLASVDAAETRIVLGFAGGAGVPHEFPARCARAANAGVGSVQLTCEASLDGALEVSSEARSQGVTASLEGRATLDATLDVATGLCLSAVHHIEMTVVERMGAYEEREAAILDVRTELTAADAAPSP